MSNNITPVRQEVTSLEASQGVQQSRRVLSDQEKIKVSRFIQAHQRTKPDSAPVVPAHTGAAAGAAQVTATEQASAMAGVAAANRPRSSGSPKFEAIYADLYSNDPDFMMLDLRSLVKSFNTNSQSLCDVNQQMGPDEKAFRKYLLVEIGLNRPEFSADRGLLEGRKQSLLTAHQDYIEASLAAYEVKGELKTSSLSGKEFVRAWQTVAYGSDEGMVNLLGLYRAVRGKLARDVTVQKINDMLAGFALIVPRENKGRTNAITERRHYMIRSRVSQLHDLMKMHALHSRFLDLCQKAELKGLPQLSGLMEACIQSVATADVFAGVNTIVRMASQVTSPRLHAANIFASNYGRYVLRNDLIESIYLNKEQRFQVFEILEKNVRAGNVLSIGARREHAE